MGDVVLRAYMPDKLESLPCSPRSFIQQAGKMPITRSAITKSVTTILLSLICDCVVSTVNS